MTKTLMIVAGETSGDLHGSILAKELKKLLPKIRLIGMGGEKMRQAGVEIIEDSTQFASVGLIEAMQNFSKYARLYRLSISAIHKEKPNLVVLIDLPDFNLRFGKRVKERSIPIVYYISPQVWAWRPGRVKEIAKVVKKMLVIFEFEKEIYESQGVDVEWVGHPLLDTLHDVSKFDGLRQELQISENDLVFGLLPGSREKEFKRIFPIMCRTVKILLKEFPQAKFLVGCAPNIKPDLANTLKKKFNVECTLLWDKTYEVIRASNLLIVASGTVTVESAILGTPMIVTYKINSLTALLFLPFAKIKDFAMVNIVAGRRIMPEYYQWLARPELIAREAIFIVKEDRLEKMRKDLDEVKAKLGTPGASYRTAESILKLL